MKKHFRVYLRALELDDYKRSIHWRKNDEIWSMVAGPKHFVSEAYEKKWVEDAIFNSSSSLTLAIVLHQDDEHIGYVYLNQINHHKKSASSAILLGESKHWGKGLSTEAYQLLLQHSFDVLGLERVQANQLLSNTPSIGLHKKCGYKQEGVLRKAIFKDGIFRDLNVMSIIKEDYVDMKNSLLLKEG